MPGLFHYLVDSYFPGPVTADSTIPIRAVLVHPIPDEHGCVVECFLFVLIGGLQFDGSISLSKRQRLLIVKVWASNLSKKKSVGLCIFYALGIVICKGQMAVAAGVKMMPLRTMD